MRPLSPPPPEQRALHGAAGGACRPCRHLHPSAIRCLSTRVASSLPGTHRAAASGGLHHVMFLQATSPARPALFLPPSRPCAHTGTPRAACKLNERACARPATKPERLQRGAAPARDRAPEGLERLPGSSAGEAERPGQQCPNQKQGMRGFWRTRPAPGALAGVRGHGGRVCEARRVPSCYASTERAGRCASLTQGF